MLFLFACLGTKVQDTAQASVVESPVDDPAQYDVDDGVDYVLELGDPQWVVPADNLPVEDEHQASNNNVDIVLFAGRLFLSWRTGPNHFASTETEMWIVSSADMGQTWSFEHRIALEADVREPRFFVWNDVLHLIMFEAGTNPAAFEPLQMWRTERIAEGLWQDPEPFGPAETVPWDVKVRNGRIWMTTYDGAHYGTGDVFVRFWVSDDGYNWSYVDDQPHVYVGGVSEVAFEFDAAGDLWAVGRNEDGDQSGAGTNICFAEAAHLGTWSCSAEADPERYDSPELFRHGSQIYLAARRDIDGPFGPEGNLLTYSMRPKRSSLYRLDTESAAVVHIQDIPGVGDTAFPSIHRVDTHQFILANYTSPLDDPDISWLDGQLGETKIYLMDIRFRVE